MVERTVVATLLPKRPCAIEHSELTTSADFELRIEDQLEFDFSFKPAIYRNIYGLDSCDNVWKIQDVQNIGGNGGRLSSIFEVFQYEIQVVSDNEI